MNSEVSPASIEGIYSEAVQIEDPAERLAFLADRCADDQALLARVNRLLAARSERGGFLAYPGCIGPWLTGPSEIERAGNRIGAYRLLEEIGEGGMGIVYLAEQIAPVQRQVALKLIKPGMDSQQVVARFEAERQTLSIMEHPNIAQVFEAGTTESGRPFFAMELVRGAPITDFCDQRRLPVDERLAIFISVCHAVQHAHQRGVIHRDLKPSNILVDQIDGKAVPKVIDFGVAKAIGGASVDQAVLTSIHQFIGTPLYMSPEQAGQSNGDIDTRSDVYALGVVLYELLVGVTPIDQGRLRDLSWEGCREIIRAEEPPIPSRRFESLDAAQKSFVSDRRRTTAGGLASKVRGELDWIIVRCLEKDRNRRYESASALASDLLRYLNDEPVTACPPSRLYRCAKLFRRHRTALLVAAFTCGFLIIGMGVSTWQAIRATRAERAAKAALESAEQRRLLVYQAVDKIYVDVFQGWLNHNPKLTDGQDRVLDNAVEIYRKVAAEPGAGTDSLQVAADAAGRVGYIQLARGRFEEAAAAFQHQMEIEQELVDASPSADGRQRHLAIMASTCCRLADAYGALGRIDAMERQVQRAFGFVEAVSKDGPASAHVVKQMITNHSALGILRQRQGRDAEAEQAFRKAVTLCETSLEPSSADPDRSSVLAMTLINLARQIADSRPDEAEGYFRRSISILDGPQQNSLQLVDAYMGLARLHITKGAEDQGEDCYERAGEVLDVCLAQKPYDLTLMLSQWDLLNATAELERQRGKTSEAEMTHRKALHLAEELVGLRPDSPDFQSSWGASLHTVASLLSDDSPEKGEKLRQAIECQRKALELTPNMETYLVRLRNSTMMLMYYAIASGDRRVAVDCAEALANEQWPVIPDFPATVFYHEAAKVFVQAAQQAATNVAAETVSDSAEAVWYLSRAREMVSLAKCVDGTDAVAWWQLAESIYSDASIATLGQDFAVELATDVIDDADTETARENGQLMLACAWYRKGRIPDAVAGLEKSSAEGGFLLAMAYLKLGRDREARERFDRTSEWLVGYLERDAEWRTRGVESIPDPVNLKKLQREAEAMLKAAEVRNGKQVAS
ncbi:MAG: serine/threonine-protein kinase [Pirellulales bacterium]